MGIFDFFKKTKPKDEEKQAEVWDTRELNKKVEELEKEELHKFYADIESLRKELGEKLSEVKNLAITLEKSNMAKDVDKRLVIKIESSKRNLVNRTKNASDFFFDRKLKTVDGLENLNKLLDVASQVFNQINEVGSKYAEITELGFSGPMSDLERGMKSANDLFKKLIKLSEENRKLLESMNAIKTEMEKLNMEIKRLDESKSGIESLHDGSKKAQEKEAELLNKKEKIEDSNAYKSALSMKERLDSLEKEKHSLMHDFRNDFLIFKKPIQKYLYSFGPGLGKDMYSKIEKYLDEPLAALANDENMDIAHALTKICEFAKDKKLDFESKLKDKLCAEINRFLEQKKLEVTLKKYQELENEISSLKNDITKSIINDCEQLSKEIEKNNSEIKENNKKVELADKALLNIEENIKKIKSEIEKYLKSDFSRKIKLD